MSDACLHLVRKAARYLWAPRVTRWRVATALVLATMAFLFVMILMAHRTA